VLLVASRINDGDLQHGRKGFDERKALDFRLVFISYTK
jgi:hypothetical protein